MKKLLLPFLLLILIGSCTGQKNESTSSDDYDSFELYSEEITEEITEEPDTTPPFTISKKKSSGYNVWSIEENPKKVAQLTGPYYYECCPDGLFDKPMSGYKAEIMKDAVVSYRDATWGAAKRALSNLIPIKDSKIIFDFSKFNRQVNSDHECLFFGPCQIKNQKGKYVDAEVSMTVKWNVPEDPRRADGWYCSGNIVF